MSVKSNYPKIFNVAVDIPENGHILIFYKRSFSEPILGTYSKQYGFRKIINGDTEPLDIDYNYWAYTGSTFGVGPEY